MYLENAKHSFMQQLENINRILFKPKLKEFLQDIFKKNEKFGITNLEEFINTYKTHSSGAI